MNTTKFYYFTLAIVLLLASCQNKQMTQQNVVHLKGQLIDMGSQNVNMSYNGAASMIGDSRDILIHTDEQGYFDTTFVLHEPAYFNISRNTLYLSPGDELEVKITNANHEAEFKGTSANVNDYMKYRLFPKGGSFLEAGSNVVGDFITTKNLIDSLAAIRFHQLDTLTGASKEFKELELARIKADIVNSYTAFMGYAAYAIQRKGLDFEAPKSVEEHYNAISEYAYPLIKDIVDPKFLDVAVVRDVVVFGVMDTINSPILFKDIEIPERTRELAESFKQVKKLRNAVTKEIAEEVTVFATALNNKDFEVELEAKVKQASKLFAGQPAIDFTIQDVEGNEMPLSSLKGKVIYIDLWATWCGPCIQESPYFESLAEKYADKDIEFLPISTDKGTKVWLDYLAAENKKLKQYHSSDTRLTEGWSLMYIPRFILIDKNFNIVDAYAPRPSQDEMSQILDDLLS